MRHRPFLLTLLALPLAAGDAAPTREQASAFMRRLLEAGGTPAAVRTVTRGPKHHWFGYYDKLQWDPSGRYLLSNEVDFEHRSPRADDVITVGMVDLQDGDRWIALGRTPAWNWQQGCQLQWLPGSAGEVLWNDREGDRFVCRVYDVAKRQVVRTLPRELHHVSADGRWGVSVDSRRLQSERPGYGYAGIPDPEADQLAPERSGVWVTDITAGTERLVLSIATLARIPNPAVDNTAVKHRFEHVAWNTDATRFLFLHRWRTPNGGFASRMYSAAADGSDLRLVTDRQDASHFVWDDARHITIWLNNGYWRYTDDGSNNPTLLWAAPNGHQSYLPGTGNAWLVTDSYPFGAQREQPLYLYHLPTHQPLLLGRFPSPKAYAGEWRCDTHPRISPDGKWLCIDSPHNGEGRQLHVVDIAGRYGK